MFPLLCARVLNQSNLESVDLKAEDLETEIFILVNGGFRYLPLSTLGVIISGR
ncbi:hypothetical protein LguiA_031723 [Lonicera macranthoides]